MIVSNAIRDRVVWLSRGDQISDGLHYLRFAYGLLRTLFMLHGRVIAKLSTQAMQTINLKQTVSARHASLMT
jgi:hypothetical protein